MLILVDRIKSLSILTDKDYIELVSTFSVMTNPMFRCSLCHKRYPNEPDRQAKVYENQKCRETDKNPIFRYRPETKAMKGYQKINYFTCIGNLYSPYWASIINYYEKYSKGILPYNCGDFELPSKFVESMDLVHNLISENEELQKKKLAKVKGKYGGR